MNAPNMKCADKKRDRNAIKGIQINTSPASGEVDFSPLGDRRGDSASLDLVSIADLLRNAFVYPPHTIYRDVKIAATGFDPDRDMYDHPQFHFDFQSALAPKRPSAATADDHALLQTYHRLLCDAVVRSTAPIQSPWLLQSGGKDSTSMAIAVAEARPNTTCITYLGGLEENEVGSARFVAKQLGLRHEVLVCDPGRAYDRYLAIVPRMPLLTADFAVLSYVDLATEVGLQGGDGIIDALGSDQYFGVPLHRKERVLAMLARHVRLPQGVFNSPLISRSFKLCFALSTLQMDRFERYFAGSRFNDAEVDALLGQPIAARSRERIATYRADLAAAKSAEAVRRVTLVISEAAHLAKGMYVIGAMPMRLVYPYCDEQLRDWTFHEVPDELLIGPDNANKVLMRRHIAEHFKQLPYVRTKGSFRFDLCGLAKLRFDQVHAFSLLTKALLPGAPRWLEDHRSQLDNKYFASKFYLLAMMLPWLHSRMEGTPRVATEQILS